MARASYRLAEAVWLAIFTAAGLILRPRIKRVAFSREERVLVIAPHADDETIGCRHAIAMHAAAGAKVVVVAVTDGRASGALGLDPIEMARRRAGEFEAAVNALGATPLQLALPEGRWSAEQLRPRLREVLEREVPSVIYAPSVVDYHQDHLNVARCLAEVLSEPVAPVEVRVYQVQVPLTTTLANVATANNDPLLARRAARAEQCYVTQARSVAQAHRLAAQSRALWRTPGPTNVFWSQSAAAYARAMANPTASFRGIRDRPLTDPWSWISGRRERRRLARLARGTG